MWQFSTRKSDFKGVTRDLVLWYSPNVLHAVNISPKCYYEEVHVSFPERPHYDHKASLIYILIIYWYAHTFVECMYSFIQICVERWVRVYQIYYCNESLKWIYSLDIQIVGNQVFFFLFSINRHDHLIDFCFLFEFNILLFIDIFNSFSMF